MKNINGILKIALGACLACGVASASTTEAVQFNFTGATSLNNNNAYSSTSTATTNVYSSFSDKITTSLNPVLSDTVTATAYQESTNTTNSLTAAYGVGYYSGAGMGACSTVEHTTDNCASPDHQIDNAASEYEFILYTFTTPVSLTSLQLANFDSGTTQSGYNMSNTIILNPTINGNGSITIADSGTGVYNENCTDSNNLTTTTCGGSIGDTTGVTLSLTSGTDPTLTETFSTSQLVTSFLIGASIASGQSADLFKVQDINANIATPEPASFGMIGMALLGLGLAGRKKFQSRNR
jgi:hypothetical protein